MDEDRFTPSPIAKRRRVSDSGRGHAGDAYARPFYFPDGDIVFKVALHTPAWTNSTNPMVQTGAAAEHQWHFFKIHRSRLSCSEFFEGMLDVPQPPDEECYDGCALVEAPDDAKDWMVLLQWMYHPETFSPHCSFDTLAGALRLSTKYLIPALRSWAVTELLRRWPTDLLAISPTHSFPHAAEAINLARELDVPHALPAAFYALALQRWRVSADGGRAHVVLAPADLRRVLAGREAQEDVVLELMRAPLGGAQGICAGCAPVLERAWRDALSPDPQMPWVQGCWLLRALRRMVDYPGAGFAGAVYAQTTGPGMGVACAPCVFTSQTLASELLREVKKKISGWFFL